MVDKNANTVGEVFIRLIRRAINPDVETGFTEPPLDEEKQKLLFQLSQLHDLAHLVYMGADNGTLLTDPEIRQKFRKAKLMSIARYEQLNLAYREITQVFEAEEIPFLPLKGARLREYYAEPWMRTSCDIDLLVEKENLERAATALVERLGYRREEKIDYHDLSLYSPTNNHLELHFNILENQANVDKLLTKVWQYCEKVDENSVEYRQSNEFFLFHLLAHLLYHFLAGGCGVRPVLDLWVLDKKLSVNKEVFAEMLKECGLVLFYQSVMQLASVWFDGKEHTDRTQKLENYIFSGGVYGTFQNKMKVTGTKVKGKKGYFIRKIFCPYEVMKVKYPVLQKHKWLLPFYEVVRWIQGIFGGKIRNVKKESSTLDSISKTEQAEFSELLKELGL